MVKGREYAPSRENDGNWYKYKRTKMSLTKHFVLPLPAAPQNSQQKCKESYNIFSIHDNRHSLQDKGEYFGNGLGKRIVAERRQHISRALQTNPLCNPIYNSTYQSSYQKKFSKPCEQRRFPRIYPKPAEGTSDLTTTTTKWWEQSNTPFKTELQVLALAQEPHSKPNKWKYSYEKGIFPWIATRSCKTDF